MKSFLIITSFFILLSPALQAQITCDITQNATCNSWVNGACSSWINGACNSWVDGECTNYEDVCVGGFNWLGVCVLWDAHCTAWEQVCNGYEQVCNEWDQVCDDWSCEPKTAIEILHSLDYEEFDIRVPMVTQFLPQVLQNSIEECFNNPTSCPEQLRDGIAFCVENPTACLPMLLPNRGDDGITVICDKIGTEHTARWYTLFGYGELESADRIVGGGDNECFGRCGNNCDGTGFGSLYTQDCFDHDVCGTVHGLPEATNSACANALRNGVDDTIYSATHSCNNSDVAVPDDPNASLNISDETYLTDGIRSFPVTVFQGGNRVEIDTGNPYVTITSVTLPDDSDIFNDCISGNTTLICERNITKTENWIVHIEIPAFEGLNLIARTYIGDYQLETELINLILPPILFLLY